VRKTQIIGLPLEATKFLNKNCKKYILERCGKCGHPTQMGRVKRIYDSAASFGMFDDGPNLYEYKLRNGSVAKEMVQEVPWSSGPCIFLMLTIDGKVAYKWTRKEIREMT